MNQLPSIATHIPVEAYVPDESNELRVGRPDAPTPSLWQKAVRVKHRATGKTAVVVRVDWVTNMFRAYYPDEGAIGEDGKPAGRFSERTEWEQCAAWDVEVTFSPAELERQAAKQKLDEEISKLDAKSLAAMTVLVDGDDPQKALAKLNALRQLGLIQAAPEAAQAAIAGGPNDVAVQAHNRNMRGR